MFSFVHSIINLLNFLKNIFILSLNFKRILKKSGVEVRKLYNLQHTFASQMISKDADIVWVSNMFEHKDVSITLKIYTKFI